MDDSDPPWGSIPFTAFNFAENCALSGRYLAFHLTQLDEPPISIVQDFFQTVKPAAFDSLDLEDDILPWHKYLSENSMHRELERSPQFTKCLPELCASVTHSASNDLIGIGLLVALALELVLMVGYCATAIAIRARRVPGGDSAIPPASEFKFLDRVLYAFYSTTTLFFNLATVFSIGMSVTLIYNYAAPDYSDVYSRPTAPARTYYGLGTLVMGAAYFPLVATVPAYLWSSRRQWIDFWPALVACIFASAAIIFSADSSYNYYSWRWLGLEDTLLLFCPNEVVPESVQNGVVPAAHGVVSWCPALLALVMAFAVAFFKCSGVKMWAWRPARLTLRGLIIIYAVLGFIGASSYTIMALVFAGRSSWLAESRWTLGQGVVLALWLPLLYELVHVFIVGLDHGLEVRLPKQFVAVRDTDLEPAVEPEFVPGMAPGPRGVVPPATLGHDAITAAQPPLPAVIPAQAVSTPADPEKAAPNPRAFRYA
ncbi:uncharacterized protein DNG_02079 [Cephalotrichum gorgonifer]|uniref:Uncharacterized protein n=1 Tax=Cephalotrichum gorgonifer TaxID=2041049 RepID=A0AAE8SSC8_9PEZI|nr:uncharacterized protein DNG_02079 [Cephalotrichum gorgonifer]